MQRPKAQERGSGVGRMSLSFTRNVRSPPARPSRRVTAIIGERLDVLSPAALPPLVDLGVRVIVELYPALRVVRPLVRVPVRDRRTLEFGRHRLSHRVVARALLGAVGKVEDRLVQAGGRLRRRRAWQAKVLVGLEESGDLREGGDVG